MKRVMDNANYFINNFLNPRLQHHKQTYSEGHAEDFIYAYLRQMRAMEGKDITLNGERIIFCFS
jgi:hypothetical protein